jgi:hypothetical protein
VLTANESINVRSEIAFGMNLIKFKLLLKFTGKTIGGTELNIVSFPK